MSGRNRFSPAETQHWQRHSHTLVSFQENVTAKPTHVASTHFLRVALLETLNFLLLTLQHLIPDRLTQHHRLCATHDATHALTDHNGT